MIAIFLLLTLMTQTMDCGPLDTDCPEPCKCADGFLFNVSCSYEGLTTIPNLTSLQDRPIHLLKLDLNIIREISDSAFQGLEISEINLGFNPIVNISSRAFGGLEDVLTSLTLRQTDLTSLPSSFLSSFTKLKMLDLSDTKSDIFANITGETLPDLPALVDLNLNYCGITELSDDAFGGLDALVVLSLRENKLTSIPAAIKSTTLREIDFSMNKITQINADAFQGLDQLEIMKLDYNEGVQISLRAFTPLASNLHTLKLAWSDLTEVPASIKDLTSLKHLDISGNLISEVTADTFLGLDHLETLNLSENIEIKFSGQEAFNGIENSLKELLLSSTSLTEIPLEPLESITSLETLDLSRNKLSLIGDLSGLVATTIDLSHNEIRKVEGPFGEGPLRLDLSHNDLTQVDFIDDLCQYEMINLDGNRLHCTCNLLALVNVPSVAASGDCAAPPELLAKPFQDQEVVNHFNNNCGYAGRNESCAWFVSDVASCVSLSTSVCALLVALHLWL